MNRMCNSALQDTVLQISRLISSGCPLKVQTEITKILSPQPFARYCIGCGRDVLAGKFILHQEGGVIPSTRWLLLGRSAFSHTVVSERLHGISRSNNILDSSSALNQNFSGSRNYSTTSRVFAVEAPSATLSIQTISSSSSSGLIGTDYFPIFGAEKAIEYIHNLTGLPWWSTIVLTAFVLRVVLMLPLTIHSFRNLAKLQHLQTEVAEKAQQLRKEVTISMYKLHWSEKRATLEYSKNLKNLLKELYIRDNCHPMKGIAVFWVQMPLWISVTYALRNLSTRAGHPDLDGHMDVKDLTEQGLAWFPDLTITDSTWLLPVLMGTVTLLNIEINYLNLPEVTKYRKWLTYGLRGVALFIIPVCSTMPNSMVLYWISSGTFAAVQNLLFEYSPFRRLIGLPKSTIESHAPLRALSQKARAKYWKR